ncbi:MAG: hypothetical protein JWN70_6583 [Planctomycetaceae bacterium]|nr:hypothetical protein [Planctomycetaceae bacterium]
MTPSIRLAKRVTVVSLLIAWCGTLGIPSVRAEPYDLLSGHNVQPSSIAFSPDGKTLASAGVEGKEYSLRLWDVSTKTQIAVTDLKTSDIGCLAFTPRGKTLLAGSKLISLDKLKTVAEQAVPVSLLQGVSYSSTGRMIAGFNREESFVLQVGGAGRTVLRSKGGGLRDTREVPYIYEFVSAAIAPNRLLLVVGTRGGQLRFFDAQANRELPKLDAHESDVTALAFSPNGKILATGGADGLIKLWDTWKWTPSSTVHGHTQTIRALSILPDNETLISGSGDRYTDRQMSADRKFNESGELKLWAIPEKQQPAKPIGSLTTPESIEVMAVARDGSHLATVHLGQKEIRLWRVSALRDTELDPQSTPGSIAAAGIDIRDALTQGLVAVEAKGDGLEALSVSLKCTTDAEVKIIVPLATRFAPAKAGPQDMVVLEPKVIKLNKRDDNAFVSLSVACATMARGTPGPGDRMVLAHSRGTLELRKLISSPAFAKAPFEIRQYAIWTVTDNPQKTGYTGIGTQGVPGGLIIALPAGIGDGAGSGGPSAAERAAVGKLMDAAGIYKGRYAAFRNE